MFGFPTQKQYVTAPICLLIIMFMLEFTKPLSMAWFGFTPNEILNGELWRLITGQLLHTNLNHLYLNSAGLALVWALHGEYYNLKQYMMVILTSLTLVGIGLILFAEYRNYAGLSGILHTLIVYGAIVDIHKRDKTGWLLLTGVILKVIYEMAVGPAQYTEQLIQASVAVEAHLIGCLSGVLMGIVFVLYRAKQKLGLN